MVGRGFSGVVVALVLSLAHVQIAAAQLFETRASQGFMIDADTGTVLFSKDPDTLIPPASLAKLMTMEVVFNALKTGRLSLQDEFYVSENAWRTGGAMSGGSTMFAEVRSSITLENLIQGVIVQSANDGCIIIAEGMAGSEDNFAQLMTERAREIGLTRSVFKNSTGLPAEGQVVTVRELAILAHHIWKEYPEYYQYYSQPDFTWNNITQRNRNPLLRMNIGADGMKTGFTTESGYGIVGSVARDDRRLFVALSGMESDAQRAEEARKIIDWGMRAFDKYQIFAADEVVGEAKVYGGAKSGVALRSDGPISLFVPLTNRDRLVARIVYDGPVMAPVEEGARVGVLRVWIGDAISQETPLYAAESVGQGALHQRALDAVEELAIGWMR
ncbi:D-alanyl-D-alanine carboxypeptidase [Aliihoeflea aestuarii]|jgi:serine-type D-Ala-D-Ala carboxypeptidase (penicillin-binding protein 5/6)|uniref:D-alanyl-D-alanine carboxypeptidase family protein n=1 Tax=Aliihoeflea aestuarii TaxID=453840 RepID=UPI0020927FFD|nr:D-alanyl-D-alanine carboxypeptidase family protein [Aliihoeflea aestuarii]MCO6390400.1 D-alanyl-D-alanine carboxypeptidase [Aliihoeflea aestuarii]